MSGFLELPQIKIEVDRMKYAIVHAFSQHNEEIEKVLDEELTKTIENYPFAEEIRALSNAVISQAITDALKHHFLYGEGNKIIQEEVNKRIKDA